MNIKLILIININSSRRDFTKKVLKIHRKEQLFIYFFNVNLTQMRGSHCFYLIFFLFNSNKDLYNKKIYIYI